MVDRPGVSSSVSSLFESSIKHNLQVLSGDGPLGGSFQAALERSSDYGDFRVIETIANAHGQIVGIGSPDFRPSTDSDELAHHGQNGPYPPVRPRSIGGSHAGSSTSTSIPGHRTLFLVDLRSQETRVDVIVPADLDPEGRAVLWETTRRFRGTARKAA